MTTVIVIRVICLTGVLITSLFDVIAEVILWASRTNDLIELQRGERTLRVDEPEPPEPPGVDLTSYPL